MNLNITRSDNTSISVRSNQPGIVVCCNEMSKTKHKKMKYKLEKCFGAKVADIFFEWKACSVFIVGTDIKELAKEKKNQLRNLMGGSKYFAIVGNKQISEDIMTDFNCQIEKNTLTISTPLTSMFHMETA